MPSLNRPRIINYLRYEQTCHKQAECHLDIKDMSILYSELVLQRSRNINVNQ